MCSPHIIESVRKRINRRKLLQGAVAATAGTTAGCLRSSPDGSGSAPESQNTFGYSRVVDLTHTLHKDFPAWFVAGQEMTSRGGRNFTPPAIVDVKPVFEWEHEKSNLNHVSYWEHVGTHMDAPAHFSEGSTADEIPAEDLVLPLAVIDIKAKAAQDPLALMTLEDLKAWEAQHGDIPQRALVAMNSGWATHVDTPKFKSLDENGKHCQPALHIEAVEYLMEDLKLISYCPCWAYTRGSSE